MKAITFNPENDQFQVNSLPIPQIRETDVLIKVDACGLNPVDAKAKHWKSMAPNMSASWVPGLDVSGQIVEIGKEVKGWKIDDRILCHGNMFLPHGGFAEYSVQDHQAILPHPALSSEIAASTPCAGWTAWRALNEKLQIGGRESILITGGSGGVGGFAIQIAKYFDLQTIIATCSNRNLDYVQELGATHAIDYTTENIIERVLEITHQKGVAVGLDTVGADNDRVVANSLQYEGQMVGLVGTVKPTEYDGAFMKGLSFHQLSLGSSHRYGPKSALVNAGKQFSLLLEQGKIHVPVLNTIGLEDVGEALNGMLNQRTVGKIVMKI